MTDHDHMQRALAREMLADAYVSIGEHTIAAMVRSGRHEHRAAMIAIAAALRGHEAGPETALIDFYVCDSCGHYYMDEGITCDCSAAAVQPPLRHVRMAEANKLGEMQG